ncbi:MAG: tRNA(Ile)(2)-agmatinylcytidine synthase [Sulfolobales archaeon]
MVNDSRIVLHIGFDDIDSQFNGCTTHFTYKVVKELIYSLNNDIEFIDYPNLVRLNPSIPFKTRGNAAVALRFKVPINYEEFVIDSITRMLDRYISSYEGRDGCEPGFTVIEGDVPEVLNKLYMRALTDYVHIDYVKNIINKTYNLRLPVGISRGIIGALAAIGWMQGTDCTYELIAYRNLINDSNRCVVSDSVKEADLKYKDYVFNNYDYESNSVLITPHGSNPVLLGIRGENPEVLIKYFNELNICETYSGYMIFRSNQGTDSHLIKRDINEVRPYRTLCVDVSFKSKPTTLRGGDIIIKINKDPPIYAVFYKETSLSSIVKELNENDEAFLCGSVKQWSDLTNVINVEKIFIKRKNRTYIHNPKCPICGKRMKSAGNNKGFKCEKCGFKSRGVSKEIINVNEEINKLFITKINTMKHLTKPLCRYGREKRCNFTKPTSIWIS